MKRSYLVIAERFLPLWPRGPRFIDDEHPVDWTMVAVLANDTLEASALPGDGVASAADGELCVAAATLAS